MKLTGCATLLLGWMGALWSPWKPLYAQEQLAPMQATTGSLFEFNGPGEGWNAGLRLEFGNREAPFPDGTWKMDTRRLTARIGRRVTASTHVWAELGMAQADRRGREGGVNTEGAKPVSPWLEQDSDGDSGIAWGAGGGLVLLNAVLRESPVLGPLEWLSLELEASYRIGVSDLAPVLRRVWDPAAQEHLPLGGSSAPEAEEFSWRDLQMGPVLVYRRQMNAEAGEASFLPTGYVLRGGIRFTRSQYEFQGMEEEESLAGLDLGAELRLRNGWMCRVDAGWLGSADREIGLSLIRYF